MSQFISAQTGLCYRTRPMDATRAAAFARCLTANAAFTAVETHDAKTKAAKKFVTFRPTSQDRCGDMLEREQDKRAAKAEAEGDDYIFWPDPDHTGVYWCFNPLSGETYSQDSFSCSCADWQFRCRAAGCQCKHIQARQRQAAAGRLGKTDKVSPAAPAPRTIERFTPRASLSERFAAAGLSINEDF